MKKEDKEKTIKLLEKYIEAIYYKTCAIASLIILSHSCKNEKKCPYCNGVRKMAGEMNRYLKNLAKK